MTVPADPGVEGAVNFRDVGGLQAQGGTVRTGVLFRSGALSHVTERGAARMAELGIRRIVDFRAEGEAGASPSAQSGIETIALPLLLGSVESLFRPDMTLERMYRTLRETAGEKIVTAARLIASDGATLVHCTAGKDRTGVTIALVLSAVGVPDEQVVADYARTEELLPDERGQEILDGLRRYGLDRENLVALAMASPAGVMRDFLAETRERHGSAAEWFGEQGLEPGGLAALRNRLVG